MAQNKKQFPKATLDIYFGWTHWGLLSPQQELKMRIQIDQLSRNGLDVRHIGQVSHDTLNRAYEKASLWTYPCIMPETFCITALRAQMAGAVPVIIEGSALKETVRHGYKCATKEEYLATLIEAMKKIDKVTLEERTRMGDFILKDFTWKDIATKWKRLFDRQAETYKDDQYVDMTIPPSISNTNELDHNITIVSAFFDIGRRDWKKFTRGSDYYIDSFLNYLNLDYKMVVFVDDRYIDKMLEHYEKSPHQNKIFIPINISWLEKNIYAWKQLEKARAIMNSAYYQDVFKARIANQYPENIYPEYDAINHAKIDFIDYAIKNNLVQDDFVCWSDFGYHKSIIHEDEQPVSVLNINGFNKDKMNFCLKSKLSEKDRDRLYTALIAPEVFAGNFFGGPKKLMGPFQNLYHECLEELYDHNISDDDQAVYLLCYFKKPEFFELYLSENKWPNALKFFQKPTLPI